MRELNLLILCFALLFATTSGAGCAGQTSQTSGAGCAGQCATSTDQGPTNTAVNNAELNGTYAFTFTGIGGNSYGQTVFCTRCERSTGWCRQTFTDRYLF